MSEERRFRLTIPVDVSEVEGFVPEQGLKIAVQTRDGALQVETVKLDRSGKGAATFTFGSPPGSLHVIVGPESAADEELPGIQTLTFDISPRLWLNRPELIHPVIKIPAYYWYRWLKWCQKFTIRGKVVCPNGRPAPGAKVCAYDVDFWWWWGSRQLVGCATTDANGAFELTFRWCCGWWPWWWWRHHTWRLEPPLAEQILPMLRSELKLRRLPLPTPKPDLTLFEELLKEERTAPLPVPQPTGAVDVTFRAAGREGEERQVQPVIDPQLLDALRERLVKRLPPMPELARLQLWPWWRWQPWWDCTPDLIFQVTQNCAGVEQVIVDEGVWETRWNISNPLDVTLVANEQACCVEQQENPPGACLVLTHACDDPVQLIGGNPGAPATPAGYRNPGLVAPLGDRPFAGAISIYGLFGDLANVDYYEFEWSDDTGASWNLMPPAAAGGFGRVFWGPGLGGGPVGFHSVGFAFTEIDGHRVVESREHFEATHDPASWGITRFWTGSRDLLLSWHTANLFADGIYHLRVKSWNVDPAGHLSNPRVLPLCNTNIANGLVLTLDNRLVGAGSGHPTTPDHPCGAGTIHECTTEPDTDFLYVRINGTTVGPCHIVDARDGGTLDIDFFAHDPDGHLAYYTLIATYGENQYVNLLSLPSATLTPGALGAPVPPASQVGPTYAHARSPVAPGADSWTGGAVAPTWNGGTLTLRVGNLREAFPVTCAYQLELRAYKRTIDSCNDDVPHRNRSEFSLTVQV